MSSTEVHMRRILTIVIVAVGVLALLAVIAFRGRHAKTKLDVTAIERDIHEHLPIGRSRAEVAAYLDERKIQHSYTGELKDVPGYRYNHSEVAIIHDISQSGILKSDVQIIFKFDEADAKMISYSVKEIVTGP